MSSMTDDGQVPELTLGWRLQMALGHAGVSVETMAEELGVTRQTVGRWMHGQGTPKLGYLRVWALRCGVPLGWLAGAAAPKGSRNVPISVPLGRAA